MLSTVCVRCYKTVCGAYCMRSTYSFVSCATGILYDVYMRLVSLHVTHIGFKQQTVRRLPFPFNLLVVDAEQWIAHSCAARWLRLRVIDWCM